MLAQEAFNKIKVPIYGNSNRIKIFRRGSLDLKTERLFSSNELRVYYNNHRMIY